MTNMPNTFKEFITEIFDSGDDSEFKWEHESDNEAVAKFLIERHRYEVKFVRKANKTDWELTFALVTHFDTEHHELTKTGNEFKVFANVASAVKHFLHNYMPGTLYFIADKTVPVRANTYDKLLKYFEKDLRSSGYIIEKSKKPAGYKFAIVKKKSQK